MPPKLKLTSLSRKDAAFIEPMECLAVSKLPDAAHWTWEVKIDGYRAIAVKVAESVNLFSRTRKSFNGKFPYIADALVDLPFGTVIDGDLVAIDETGRPNFNSLQHFRTDQANIYFYVFDVVCLQNRDTTKLPLVERRKLLKTLSFKDKRIKIVDYVEAEPAELLRAIREQRIEGIVGKRKNGLYEPCSRTGSWIKLRVARQQEFVVGGYFPGLHGFDSLIVGYYDADKLMYVARTRNGFVPASRRQVFSKLKHLM
jgi:bifunctional non-homologous end joining protein LigD